VTLQPTSTQRTKVAGLSRHQSAILLLGFPALLVGTFAIVMNKVELEKRHFRSWHSVLGIAAVAWVVIQICIGGASVWFNGKAFGGGPKAKAIWKYHRLSGYILFLWLLITVALGGALSHWGERNVPLPIRLVTYVFAPLFCAASILSRMRVSKMKFF
jgi:cytochrome b-561 domain containing protein 2